MSSSSSENIEKHLTEADIREAEFAVRMLEEALAEGGEVEIKEGETWGSPVEEE